MKLDAGKQFITSEHAFLDAYEVRRHSFPILRLKFQDWTLPPTVRSPRSTPNHLQVGWTVHHAPAYPQALIIITTILRRYRRRSKEQTPTLAIRDSAHRPALSDVYSPPCVLP